MKDLAHGRRPRRQDRHRHVARSRGARAAAPRRGARAGPGGAGALSRHADHVRPGDGGRLLLRLRARPSRSRRRTSPGSSSAWPRSSTATCRSRARSGTAPKIKDYFMQHGESFKAEWADELPKDEEISVYRQGDWLDMCLGPHLPSTGKLGKAFKLTKVSGAYWRGDANNAQLQRVYGTVFFSDKDLEGLPAPHRGSREARPSQARPRDGPLPPAGRRGRHGVLASQGLDALAHARELPPAQARGRRLCRGEDAAARRPQAVGGVGPLGEVPREHVSQRERGRPARVHRRSGASASSR